jgi:hypothetical protein
MARRNHRFVWDASRTDPRRVDRAVGVRAGMHRLGDELHRPPPLNPLSELADKRSDAQLGGQGWNGSRRGQRTLSSIICTATGEYVVRCSGALDGACSLGLLVVAGGMGTDRQRRARRRAPRTLRRSSRGIAALPAWRGRGSRGSPFPRRSVCRGTQTGVARKIPLPPRQRTRGGRG